MFNIMASSEVPSIWERTVSQQIDAARRFFGLGPKLPSPSRHADVKPTGIVVQPRTVSVVPDPRFIKRATNNAPAIKQLNDLVKESSVVAHVEIAVLSKPTVQTTKDRIYAFVESAPSPVNADDIYRAVPGVTKSGLSSRVSEMYKAGVLDRTYAQSASGSWSFHYTVAETR